VRHVLAFAGLPFREASADEVEQAARASDEASATGWVGDQHASAPMFAAALPLLHDAELDLFLSHVPAILQHLARKHSLPGAGHRDSASQRAAADRVLHDCSSILDELTLYNHYGDGVQARLWGSGEQWVEFRDGRLRKWLRLLEATGRRNGLAGNSGYLLGTATPGVADLALFSLLWTIRQVRGG
jgi:glutathione S-transferase